VFFLSDGGKPLRQRTIPTEQEGRPAGSGKPDPQVFLVAAAKLGVPPRRCVVMEDAVAGVEAAKAGGMRCVGVTFVGHHPDEALRRAGADLVVKTLAEVSVADVRRLCA
jgi:beta-phosphoglucomutase